MANNTDKNVIVYQDERYTLGQQEKTPYLTVEGKTYQLFSHPYEPCTYIKDGDRLVTVIHNAFDPLSVLEAFEEGNYVNAITGKAYDPKAFCVMLEFAANHFYDTDISYIEGALASTADR